MQSQGDPKSGSVESHCEPNLGCGQVRAHLLSKGTLLLVQVEVASPQPHIKMLISRENLALPLPFPNTLPALLPRPPHSLTRHSLQPRLTNRMTKERNTIPAPLEPLATRNHLLPSRAGGNSDAVDGALEEPVGPVREHVANVDEHRRRGVVFRSGGLYGDGGPG